MNYELKNQLFFNKVTILGVGLIGASFALALRDKKMCGTIHGYGRNEDNLKRARERGIIDAYGLDAAKACEDADFILLSTPVGVFKEIVGKIKNVVKGSALFTDAGSVKGGLVYETEAALNGGKMYVGSHPIAGSDRSGIEDARADLFRGARCIVTPTEKTDRDGMEKIVAVWKALGARVELMDPYKHDEIYGVVSHLPHIIAYEIVNTVHDMNPDYIEYAGQGFRDATRIALSSPELWRDISLFNRDNLLRLIGLFRGNLERIEKSLRDGDTSGMEKDFLKAQALRKKLR